MELKGYLEGKNQTGVLYGKYSFGNAYEELMSERMLEAIEPLIRTDLLKAGVYHRMHDLDVMDIGMGRQAVTLARLGAKSVAHHDISQAHVDRFSKMLKDRFRSLPITTRQTDVVLEPPASQAYDFVYLNGIVHHFSDTAAGLRNCARAVRPGGRIWVYFYRSGTFKWFLCSMIRRITSAENLDAGFVSAALTYAAGKYQDVLTGRIMDDFFVPYIHLYTPQNYMDFMDALGFRVCGSQDIDPLADVNHDCLHHSATLVFERVRPLEDERPTDRMLTPAADIDQLDPALYTGDPRPLKCIDAFLKFEERALKRPRDMVVWTALLALHKLAAGQYYGGTELPPDYDAVERVLKHATEAL